MNIVSKDIALVGVGGNFFDILEELYSQKYNVVGYIDNEKKNIDLKYLGNENTILPGRIKKVITVGGIGKGIELRSRLFKIHSRSMINLIYRQAVVSKYCEISKNSGVIIFKGVIIKAEAKIYKNVFINSGSIIGHHASIFDNTQISLGVIVGGRTVIGKNCFIGMGAKISNNIKISDNCVIGANALITKDVPDNTFIIDKDKIVKKALI